MKYIFFTLLLLGEVLIAQNILNKKNSLHVQDSIKIDNLEEVFVTAHRLASIRKETPVAINQLTQKTIDETKAVSAFEVINKTPGVLMVNIGNEQHFMSIRQPISSNNYYLYLEDGLPIRPMGIFNHNALLEINQFNLQNIEVIKGPASAMYGSEAVGGTVNLISYKPTLEPEFKFGIQADQWGYRRIQAAGSATIGKFGFHISGISSLQKDSWMSFSDYQKNNINSRIDYKINSKTRLISNTMWGKYYSDMSGSVNEQVFLNRTYKSTTDFAYRKSDALRTRLTLEKDWNNQAASFITVYFRDNKLGQNPNYAIKWNPKVMPETAKGEVNSNNFKSFGAIAQHSQKFNFLNTKIVGGALYDHSPVTNWAYLLEMKANLNVGSFGEQTVNYFEIITERPDVKLSNYTADILNKATYAQFSFNPFENMIITAGMRYDNLKVDYHNAIDKSAGTKIYDKTTFKAGANYNIFKYTGIYINFSEGFSPPGINSIFRTKTGTGGTSGKPAKFYYDLEPATFNNYEIGGWVKVLEGNLKFDYATYYMEGKNELLSLRLPDNSIDYRSVGKTRHLGFELGGNCKLLSKQINIRFGGTVSEHSYIEFNNSDVTTNVLENLNGKQMPLGPKWSGNSEISFYPKKIPNLRTSVEWQSVGSYYINQINTIKYAGYDIFNLRAGYIWKGIEIYGNVINLTDKLYAHNVSRSNQSTSQTVYTASAPRTFLLGLQYNFSLKN